MRQSYLKNAALLTGSDVVLRLAGMGLRIWLANELGGEGMGLYQLVLAVYSLFVTLATAGVSVAATRLMAEELSGPDSARGAARGMLRRLLAAGLVLGLFAALLQLVEGFCHFFRLHQGIRTVQDKHIQIVSAQTFQNAVYRR